VRIFGPLVRPALILAVLTTQPGMAQYDAGGNRQAQKAQGPEERWARQGQNQGEVGRRTPDQEVRYAPTLKMREQEFRELVAKIRSHLVAEHIPFYGGRPDDCDASRGLSAAHAVWAGGIADVSVLTSVIRCEFDFRGGLTPSGVAPGEYVGFTVFLYAAPYSEIGQNESDARAGQKVTLVFAPGLPDAEPVPLLDDVRVLMRGLRPAAPGQSVGSRARMAALPCESYTEPLYTSRTIEQPIDVATAWSEFSKRFARLGCFPQ
jgi:hypothetical protein